MLSGSITGDTNYIYTLLVLEDGPEHFVSIDILMMT